MDRFSLNPVKLFIFSSHTMSWQFFKCCEPLTSALNVPILWLPSSAVTSFLGLFSVVPNHGWTSESSGGLWKSLTPPNPFPEIRSVWDGVTGIGIGEALQCLSHRQSWAALFKPLQTVILRIHSDPLICSVPWGKLIHLQGWMTIFMSITLTFQLLI